LALVAAVFLSASASRADDDPVAWGYALAHDLMSPYCPGRTLAQCTSPQAGELRQWIVLQAAAGASREDVEAILVERFGDGILQKPKAEGWGASAYAIPVLFFIAGGGLVYWLLRRLVGPGPQAPVPVPVHAGAVDLELERLVDEELERD
jgi:cytochrome c-type biogenesis protein CcmH/NrfF